jgi:predicted nuclease of restriction endonuclease-like (RecB) superfamily
MEDFVRKMPKNATQQLAKPSSSPATAQGDFGAVLRLIEAARTRAVAAVNTALIDLYWAIGEHISRKTTQEGWGKGTVEALSEAIQRQFPGMTGYSARNLWRMGQFFELYQHQPKLAPLVRELPWSHNLAILSRCKREWNGSSTCGWPSRNAGLTENCSANFRGGSLNEPCCRR